MPPAPMTAIFMDVITIAAMLRALVLASLFVSFAATAQPYPSKPIRWILGYPPGGGTEFIARTVANGLSPLLGQPIVIENRPGAAAILGAQAAPGRFSITIGCPVSY